MFWFYNLTQSIRGKKLFSKKNINYDDLIYPNPNSGLLNIKSPSLIYGTLIINVYDINGVKIHSTETKAFGKELIIQLPSNTTKGIYYFDVLDINDNIILIKNSFIINN